MKAQRERFVQGAIERGYAKRKIEKLFELMEQFAGYGFNKSHSAAYGFVAYVTAYLKAHYPVYFMGALLSSESGNTDKVVRYINECRDMGITILPPDFNASDWDFTPADDQTIRFGLGAIKNVGKSAVLHNRSAPAGRPLPVALSFLRNRRLEDAQQAHARKRHQGRGDGLVRRPPRAVDGGAR
jgi:DNA polymerase III alpha subunit